MKSFVAAAFAAVAVADTLDVRDYLKYVAKFGKDYSTMEEFVERAKIYLENESLINEHNATNASFILGHNQFSDMTEEELANTRGYVDMDLMGATAAPQGLRTANAVDWRDAGCVTPVKDQGQCGSCWSFSTTGTVEGAHCAKSGELLSLSEQQLVDCATTFNMGCNGGNPLITYRYLKSHYAILEDDYSYQAVQGACAYDSSPKTDVQVAQTFQVSQNNVSALKQALSQSTVSVLIEADQRVFQLYKTGVFDSAQCGTTLDHAVMLVGYGKDNGQEYWILKNSWNTTWGEQGFARLATGGGKKGTCGISQYVYYPTI